MKKIWACSTPIMRKHRPNDETDLEFRITGKNNTKKGILMEMGETGFIWVCGQWWSLANTVIKMHVS